MLKYLLKREPKNEPGTHNPERSKDVEYVDYDSRSGSGYDSRSGFGSGSGSGSGSDTESYTDSDSEPEPAPNTTTEKADTATEKSDNTKDMLDGYVNQTYGGVFIWTVESVLWSLIVYAIHVYVYQFQDQAKPPAIAVYWITSSNILITICMAGINYVISSLNAKIAKFPRQFHTCSQAYGGIVSVMCTICTSISWKSYSSTQWKIAFFPAHTDYLSIVMITLTVAMNIQWFISLILTFACTPYGRNNLSFFYIPVAVSLTLAFMLLNETATSGLGICNSFYATLMIQLYVNMIIATSFILHILSAVEFDPGHIFKPWMHSQLNKNIEFDVYACIHGTMCMCAIMVYALRADLSETTFIMMSVLMAFTVIVTLIHTFDIKGILAEIFRIDDEDEQHLNSIQKTFAVSFIEAKEIYSLIVKRKNNRRLKSQLTTQTQTGRHTRRQTDDDIPLIIPTALAALKIQKTQKTHKTRKGHRKGHTKRSTKRHTKGNTERYTERNTERSEKSPIRPSLPVHDVSESVHSRDAVNTHGMHTSDINVHINNAKGKDQHRRHRDRYEHPQEYHDERDTVQEQHRTQRGHTRERSHSLDPTTEEHLHSFSKRYTKEIALKNRKRMTDIERFPNIPVTLRRTRPNYDA